MTDRGAESPSPFSREGSRPSDGLGGDPVPETWPTYPGADPADFPPPPPAGPPAGPYADPGFDPQPTPPYASYGSSRPYDLPPTGAYGTNPYEAPPYQPTPGGYSPYGVAPASIRAPCPPWCSASSASCWPPPAGSAVSWESPASCSAGRLGTEIDAEPGRYAGRSQAVAGIVTGAIGTALGCSDHDPPRRRVRRRRRSGRVLSASPNAFGEALPYGRSWNMAENSPLHSEECCA